MTYLRTGPAAESRQAAATVRNAAREHAERGADAHIADPLFIIGTGRCGSTVFHDVLAYHPRVTWLSRLTNNYPRKPWVNSTLMRLLSLPGAEAIVRNRISPLEVYAFWDQHYRGFSAPYRDLTADDVTPHSLRALRAATQACVVASRPHLLCKITGWPRIGFLHAVYPQARFINVIRDGRAVASSSLRVGFWKGWLGPDDWGWGPLSADQRERFHAHGSSFVALAALQWEILMDAYERAKPGIPADRILEIRYEDLCADPIGVVRAACEFAQLEFAPQLERQIRGFRLRSQNDKWKEGLSPAQQDTLNDCIRDCLSRWGYRAV
jgi:omega-hydroxy-beta-dihydromenaquinone-9 sulfotransferase